MAHNGFKETPDSSDLVRIREQDGEYRQTTLGAIAALGGGAGGVQSIVAGDNVTVDATDPENPIVASTGGGASVATYLLGGGNDLADLVNFGDTARRTYGTGVDPYDEPAITATYIQSDPAPTLWTIDGYAYAYWSLELPPVPRGTLVRATATLGWQRTANSLIAAEISDPSKDADELADNSCAFIRSCCFIYASGGDVVDYQEQTRVTSGWDFYNSSWIFRDDRGIVQGMFMNFWDEAAHDNIYVDIQVGPVWGNVAGVISITSLVVETILPG